MVWSGSAGVRPRLGNFPKSCGYRTPVLGTLRRARWLVWAVLAWWLLSIGAAVASPAIEAVTGKGTCTQAHGHEHGHDHGAVHHHDHGAGSHNNHGLSHDRGLAHRDVPRPGHHHTGDCPLCVMAGAPPAAIIVFAQHQPPAHAPTFWVVVLVPSFTAAPPPGRGPPLI